MAKKKKVVKKPKFPVITIKSVVELEAILNRVNHQSYGGVGLEEFLEAVQFVQNPTPDQQLTKWHEEHDIEVCDDGREKILAAAKAGKITTWPQYFETHWNDNDGVLGWLEDFSSALVGKYVDLSNPNDDWDYYPSFASFRKANPGLKFIAWPFAAKSPQKKKK